MTQLQIVGDLARRIAIRSERVDAQRLLAAHLQRVLREAGSGLPARAEVCQYASKYAVALAQWSQSSVWIDYVVARYLEAKCSLPMEVVPPEGADVRAPGPILLRDYIEAHDAKQFASSDQERACLGMLQNLAAPDVA